MGAINMNEKVVRNGIYASVLAMEGYKRPGEVLCFITDTGNGFIAKFPSHSATHQDFYVCLDYAQAHDLILGLSAFKKELDFAV